MTLPHRSKTSLRCFRAPSPKVGQLDDDDDDDDDYNDDDDNKYDDKNGMSIIYYNEYTIKDMMMMVMLIAQKQLEKLKRQIAQQTEVIV